MGLSTPKTPVTPIPEQAQFETQIDNVAGTKVERVKQPDGTWAEVRSALPLSPEEQAYQDQLKAAQQSSLQWIDKLTNDFQPGDIPWLDQYLADYKVTNTKAIDDNAVATGNAQEKQLARFGQADSTAAQNARAQQFGIVTQQKNQLSRDMSGIAEDARNQAVNQQGSLYNLATGALNGQQSTQLASLSSLVGSGFTQEQNQQNYNNSVAATIGANNAAKANSQQLGLGNLVGLTQLATPLVGSLYGAVTGGLAKSGLTGGWANYGNTSVNWNSGRVA